MIKVEIVFKMKWKEEEEEEKNRKVVKCPGIVFAKTNYSS